MDRKTFLKSLVFASAAMAVPKVFIPKKVVEPIQYGGILYHISHYGNYVDYEPGNLRLTDLQGMIDVMNRQKKPVEYYYP